MFVPRYSEQQARMAVATSTCYSEVLRKLGLRPAGGNHRLLRKYVDEVWRIPTDHFDPNLSRVAAFSQVRPVSLERVLVEDSTYDRASLKRRLFAAGLKVRRCELCGQDENWHGKKMALILDHINGVPDDNRFQNLRIVCPNCAATFETHCGRKNRLEERECRGCGDKFVPRYKKQRYCSSRCGVRHDRRARGPQPTRRKVERPSHEQLLADLQTMSFVAVGRKYGVSDNAIRKWLRWYQRQAERARADEEEQAGREGVRDEEQAA
jgi:hypothetical protein